MLKKPPNGTILGIQPLTNTSTITKNILSNYLIAKISLSCEQAGFVFVFVK